MITRLNKLIEEFKGCFMTDSAPDMFKAAELLDEIEGVNDISPMTFPFDVSIDYLREDEAKTPLSKEDALKNAKNVKDGQIKLPKVVG